MTFLTLGLVICSCFSVIYILPFLFDLYVFTIGRLLFSKRKSLRQAGTWAIITGGSDGLGKAYAEELASDGLNIMLISRTESKLKTVASELENQYKVKTKYIAADFTKPTVYEQIEEAINALPSIACLVNNVGMVNVYPEYFASSQVMQCDNIQNFLNCNCLSQSSMIRIVLPKLIKQNSGAAIINVCSFSAFCPIPLITLYTGTKSFNAHLSESLASECQGANVIFQTLYPMYISTSMVRFHKGFFIVEPREYASSALNVLGVKRLCSGHIKHALITWLYSLTPQFLINRLMWKRYRRCLEKKR